MLKSGLVGATSLFLFLGCHSALLQAQSLHSPRVSITKETGFVECYEKGFRPRTVRSPILVSPEGKHRAYVEVSAFATPSSKEGEADWPVCTNRSRLFVARPGEDKFSAQFERWAQPRFGNGLKLVDWSSDSRYLIGEWNEWKYDTDSSATYVFLFDISSGQSTVTNAYLAFNRFYSTTCGPILEIFGFRQSDGRVVIKASPEVMDDVCIEKEGFWLLDQWKNWVRPLARRPPVQKNAKWEEWK